MCVTANVETSVVGLIGFHQENNLGGGNCFAEKLLYSNSLLTDNAMGPVVYDLVNYRSKRTGNENHSHALLK